MISFLIPYRDGPGRGSLLNYVHRALKEDWPNAEIIVSGGSPSGVFNRSAARNAAADQARGTVYVFVDADSIAPVDQVGLAIAAAGANGWAFPYDRYYSLTKEFSEAKMDAGGAPLFLGDKDYEFVFPGPDQVDRPPSVGGMVAVHRDVFEQVGGYDERFTGWGFEDRAFALALEGLLGPASRIPGPLYHLWHPAPEEECFGQPNLVGNRALYDQYLAQYGNLI